MMVILLIDASDSENLYAGEDHTPIQFITDLQSRNTRAGLPLRVRKMHDVVSSSLLCGVIHGVLAALCAALSAFVCFGLAQSRQLYRRRRGMRVCASRGIGAPCMDAFDNPTEPCVSQRPGPPKFPVASDILHQ